MPAKFHTVSPTIWDRTQRQLSGPAKVVRYYVQTCPTRVSEGLFQLPLGIIVHDTGMSEEHVRQGVDQLESVGLVSYDEDAEVVLDRTALKLSPLKHGRDDKTGEVRENRAMVNAVRLFDAVPDTWLKREQFRLAETYAPDYAKELAKSDPWLGGDPDDVPFHDPRPQPPKGDARGTDGGSMGGVEKSRGEPDKRRAEVGGSAQTCKLGDCGRLARFVDGDGVPLCGEHEGSGYGEVVPLEVVFK
jgi:hypothetical protein